MRVTIALMVIGCGGAVPPSTTAPPATSGVPATFAKLFQQGAKWSFPTAITHEVYDNDDKPAVTKTTGTLACEVAATSPRPGGWNARLDCKAVPELPTSFPKELVATQTGLWELIEDVELKPEYRLLAEPPVEESGPPDINEASEGSTTKTVTKNGSRWCFGESQAVQGHLSGWSVCVRDGEFVGGTSMTGDGGITTMTWGDHDD
jgi:hypothetical protein